MTSPQLEESAGFDRSTIDYIQRAAATGLYEIRGLGAKRRVPNFDDLLFLAASLSRYPLEGYRERCATKTLLGTRFATARGLPWSMPRRKHSVCRHAPCAASLCGTKPHPIKESTSLMHKITFT